MGSEKGLEGRGRGKKRRLEGLEVKMTSAPASSSLLFFYFFLLVPSKSSKVGNLLLSFYQRHRFAIWKVWKSIPSLAG